MNQEPLMGSVYSPFALFRSMADLKPTTPSSRLCMRSHRAFIISQCAVYCTCLLPSDCDSQPLVLLAPHHGAGSDSDGPGSCPGIAPTMAANRRGCASGADRPSLTLPAPRGETEVCVSRAPACPGISGR